MMKIIRLRIECEQDQSNMIVFKENSVWEQMIEHSADWKNTKVKPLYLTQRQVPNYDEISLILDVQDLDDLADFMLEHITPIECIKDIWVVNFMKPRFFAVPKGTSTGIKRFTITINADPTKYAAIYDFISKIKPSKSVIITYLGYTLHEYGDDIMLSVLAQGKSTVEKFIEKYIAPLDCVNSTKIMRIIRTKRLTTVKEWKDFSSPFSEIEKDVEIFDLDKLFDEDWIAGC